MTASFQGPWFGQWFLAWSDHFGHFVGRHQKCAKRIKGSKHVNSCIFSVHIILTSKPNWDFCVKSYSLVSWRIIHFCANVCRAVTMRRKRNRHYIKWIQSKFREKKIFRRLFATPKKTSYQGPVPERPISANRGLKFCSTFCIYLPIHGACNILCYHFFFLFFFK